MTVTPSQYITDSILFVRDKIRTNVTDPLSRGDSTSWVLTSYPEKQSLRYPLITVRKGPGGGTRRLGHKSNAQWCQVPVEVRVWARNVKERDSLASQVHDCLRTLQNASGGSVEFELFDFSVNSSVPIDEEGTGGIHSEVIECSYFVILI